MDQEENISGEEGKNDTKWLEQAQMDMKSIFISVNSTVVFYLRYKILDIL
jgi:hypothetical protein